jgi:glycosyltransferase involved in cell wall biosynthesis
VNRRRLLWAIKGLGPGGAERLLVAAAAAHDPARYAIEVVYLLPWKDHLVGELEGLGIPCTCLGVRDERDVRWVGRLRSRLRHDPVDIVHAHSPYVAAFTRLAVRSLPRAVQPRLITTEHNPWTTFKAPTRYLNALTSRLDDRTIAVSAETLASMSPRAAARAEVLVHGIDVASVRMLRTQRDQVRVEFGLDPHTVVVGTVANYHPKKDWPNLLRAARVIADRGLPMHFLAVGQGPLEAEVRALHRELRLDGVVTLTGYRADATRVMAGADVFALGSRWEGLPVALMEATALGLPIVATAVGGVRESFTDGRDARLVAASDPELFANALQEVACDVALRERLARASACHAAEFDVTRAVRRIEAIYDDAISEGARA